MTFEEYTLEKYPNLKSSYDNFMSNYKDPMFIEMGAIYTRTNGAGGWITPISFTLTKNKEKHYRFKDVDSERSTYTYHAPQMFEQLVKTKPGSGIEPDDSKEMRFIAIKGRERYVWFNVWKSNMRGHLHLKFGYQEGEETYEIFFDWKANFLF